MSTRLLCPRDSSGNTRVGCHSLLQGIFPTQESNPYLWHLPALQAGSLPLVPPGKPSERRLTLNVSDHRRASDAHLGWSDLAYLVWERGSQLGRRCWNLTAMWMWISQGEAWLSGQIAMLMNNGKYCTPLVFHIAIPWYPQGKWFQDPWIPNSWMLKSLI